MKKKGLVILVILIFAAGYAAWNIFGPTVSAPAEKYFYIKTGASYPDVKRSLLDQKIITGGFFFDKIAKQLKYNSDIRPGRYEIKDGSSLVGLIRMLKAGRQVPVRLVINKLRTKENFASKIGSNFECDSTTVMNFITSNDSLAPYHIDTNTVLTIVIPNSYLFWWNVPFKKLFERLESQHREFWNEKRTQKATSLGLSPEQVYTLASIVEEETNMQGDKGNIASVYYNRMKKGIKLEADPTVKYAMRNFALKRILNGHLQYPSEYNTYLHTGLPPGPVCTPSINTIDAVLDMPQTDYMFFVAKPDFKGYSNFASTYAQHQVYAKAYRQALDSLLLSKANR